MNRKVASFNECYRIFEVDPKLIEAQLCAVIELLISGGYEMFIAGSLTGFDLLAARIVLRYKKEHPNIELRVILPYPTEDRDIAVSEIEAYQEVINGITGRIIYVSDEFDWDAQARCNDRIEELSDAEIKYGYYDECRVALLLKAQR